MGRSFWITVKTYAPPRVIDGVTTASLNRSGAPLNGAMTRSRVGGPPARPWVEPIQAAYCSA